jgi:hypothetical protein
LYRPQLFEASDIEVIADCRPRVSDLRHAIGASGIDIYSIILMNFVTELGRVMKLITFPRHP